MGSSADRRSAARHDDTMFITVINDCRDANAVARQATRIGALFGAAPTFAGVANDLEASGTLIDALDAGLGAEGCVLVNVAPRNGGAKRWPNGTPFCSFRCGKTLVVASVDGYALSLVKKLGITDAVDLMDIPEATASAVRLGLIPETDRARIVSTQFRSYEFLPLAGKWLTDGIPLPGRRMAVDSVADAPNAVRYVDNFGNCKTTLLEDDIGGSAVPGRLPVHPRLKDVPDGEAALIVGSSGIGERRFLEIVVQGGSAAERFGHRVGSVLGAAEDRPARRDTARPFTIPAVLG